MRPSQARSNAGHQGAAAAQHDRERARAQQRLDAVADALAGVDDRGVPDDPRFRIPVGADDAHRQVAGVTGPEGGDDAGLPQRLGRSLRAAGRAQRVDGNADDHELPCRRGRHPGEHGSAPGLVLPC